MTPDWRRSPADITAAASLAVGRIESRSAESRSKMVPYGMSMIMLHVLKHILYTFLKKNDKMKYM